MPQQRPPQSIKLNRPIVKYASANTIVQHEVVDAAAGYGEWTLTLREHACGHLRKAPRDLRRVQSREGPHAAASGRSNSQHGCVLLDQTDPMLLLLCVASRSIQFGLFGFCVVSF
jgi:hypothetical protein